MSWFRRNQKARRKRRQGSSNSSGWDIFGDILDAIADFIN